MTELLTPPCLGPKAQYLPLNNYIGGLVRRSNTSHLSVLLQWESHQFFFFFFLGGGGGGAGGSYKKL